jgi:hypothetical protein
MNDDDDVLDSGDYLDRLERRRRKLLDRIAEATEATERHTKPKLDRATMSIAEKSRYIAEHGQSEYLRLPKSDRGRP